MEPGIIVETIFTGKVRQLTYAQLIETTAGSSRVQPVVRLSESSREAGLQSMFAPDSGLTVMMDTPVNSSVGFQYLRRGVPLRTWQMSAVQWCAAPFAINNDHDGIIKGDARLRPEVQSKSKAQMETLANYLTHMW